MKVTYRNEFGGRNRGKLNLNPEWLGCRLCYHWLKSVKEARCYECRYA